MKKILLAGVVLLSTLNLNAQIDQLTALKSITEKTEFVAVSTKWNDEGKMVTYPKSTLRILSYKNDDAGDLGSFYLNESYIANKKADPGQERPNHATKPSIFYSTFTGTGSVIIGAMVYQLKRNKLENILNGNFEIAVIYEVKSEDKKEFKKQLKGKSTNLLTIDHNKVLKEYFSKMKSIQESATSNMSDEDKKKEAYAKQLQEEKEKERMKQVTADFNKGNEASPTKIALKNNSSQTINIVVDDMGYSLKPGEQLAFLCKRIIYYGTPNSKGKIIATENSSCNKTIILE